MQLEHPTNQVKVYEDPTVFWNEVSPELKKEEAKNGLVLGLSYIFKTDPNNCVYQSALRSTGGLVSALVCSRYLTNINFLPTRIESVEQAKQLLSEFQKADISINGIVGELETAEIYKKLFEDSGRKTKVHMSQGIYRCSRVKMPAAPDGLKFRLAELKDIETIGEWMQAFHHEAVPHDPPIDGRAHAKTKIEAMQVYILESEAKLLSMACWSRDIETSCCVNFVYTPKNLRGKGLGSFVTAQLTQHLLDQGKRETNLYTDLKNPTSNKIYQNIGYEFVCNSVHFGVGS